MSVRRASSRGTHRGNGMSPGASDLADVRPERTDETLLEVRSLRKYYRSQRGLFVRGTPAPVRAVDGVSFSLGSGETLALVGESGCGKTTIGRCIIGLEKPTTGSVLLEGESIFNDRGKLRRDVPRSIQVVFQDPYASLDPRMDVGKIVEEPMRLQGSGARQRREKAVGLLGEVGLGRRFYSRSPQALSGGQRQRVGIARALSVDPRIVILDEPVSALDVSIQAQILQLLARLQQDHGISYLMISHDLAVVRRVATRIAVVYLGRIVEIGSTADVLEHPTHPYTVALRSAVPRVSFNGGKGANRIVLHGEIPSPKNPPSGCRFRTRCWKARLRCAEEDPQLMPMPTGQRSACFYPEV